MDGPTLKSLPPFFSIGYKEKMAVLNAMKRPLSGYIGGGTPRGGYWTDKLEEMWAHAFKCRYAIPCNSATSGLLAACMAIGIQKDDVVWTTAYSMSATAACALVLGAKVKFIDIEPVRYSLNPNMMTGTPPKAIIVTNLFGHPAYLSVLRTWCDQRNVVLIEDNAQAIFAKEGNHYAGTIGHMGAWSLNVHKQLNCGEGGVVTTEDGGLSVRLRGAINHGELQGTTSAYPGLNLRMTEPTAAIACTQLARADEIMEGRIGLAKSLTAMVRDIPWIKPPFADHGCTHSYYVWAARIEDPVKRHRFAHELQLRGFPIREGYTKPLPQVFRAWEEHPVTVRIEQDLITFEVCAYDPKAHHLARMSEIVSYVAQAIDREETWKLQAAESAPTSHHT